MKAQTLRLAQRIRTAPHQFRSALTLRHNSAAAHDEHCNNGPYGPLFEQTLRSKQELLGSTGSIKRTFGPHCNAEGLLATGGDDLAAHASFDPVYSRARDWIKNHSVGSAVLSPVLISGLAGALAEAAFPQAVVTRQSMENVRPLVVGVPVTATIEVTSVSEAASHGYNLSLKTSVTRERDDSVISQGSHELWLPDYKNL